MFRLIVIALIFSLIFWLVRGIGRSGVTSASRELVPDALTGVYFPKDQAVAISRGGETLYFINKENRDTYLSRKTEGFDGKN